MYGTVGMGTFRRVVASTAASWIAALALAMSAGPAGAANTVGSVGPPGTCGTNFMLAQFNVAAQPSYFFPSDGVITSWSAAFTAGGQSVKLLILRRVNNGPPPVYEIVAKSDAGTSTGPGTNTFQSRIPVPRGQEIGTYGFVCASSTTSAGDVAAASTGMIADPPVGQVQALSSLQSNARAAVSATLENDCDSDGAGDETQDSIVAGSGCPLVDRSVTIDASKNKVKKGKKVTLSGQITESAGQLGGGACAANQSVDLEKSKSGTFLPFATVQTDAQGIFSLREKIKKKSSFRAQLNEVNGCGRSGSPTEKVKVKPKKH